MKKRKIFLWIFLGILSIPIIIVGVVFIIFHNEIGTILNIKRIADCNIVYEDDDEDTIDEEKSDGAVYFVKYKGGFYFDDFLKQGGASSDDEVLDFVIKHITKGIEISGIDDVACTSFTCQTTDNKRLFCRNFDLDVDNIGIIYTKPRKGRYASFSTVSLQYVGIEELTDDLSLIDKAKILAAPYAAMDGMNEKGLACSIYVSFQSMTEDEDGWYNYINTNICTDKDDLTSTTMLRMILDYASDVDSAIELVKQYDIHDSSSFTYHYSISDASGKSACLEWYNGTYSTDTDGTNRELHITYNDGTTPQIIANYIVDEEYYGEEYKDEMYGLDRYNRIKSLLEEKNNLVEDEEEALNILKEVGGRYISPEHGYDHYEGEVTTWSVVYNLTDKTVTLVSNEHYGDSNYTFKYSFDDLI